MRRRGDAHMAWLVLCELYVRADRHAHWPGLFATMRVELVPK